MIIGNREFTDKTHIMGILNVTPDSFSDGGKYNSLDKALKRTEEMINDGAEVIDIGGESTRPGYTMISDEEETERIVPVIEAVKARFDIPVSADTYKAQVAKAALMAGADMINDIWGFKYQPEIAKITAEYNASCCLMHNRRRAVYDNFLEDVVSDLKESVDTAISSGVSPDKIITDPGVGFAKSLEENLIVTKHLDELYKLEFPVLLGTSRKSMIGLTLNLGFDERVEGTLATTAQAVMKKALFVRVHDVKENYRFIKMLEAIENCDNA